MISVITLKRHFVDFFFFFTFFFAKLRESTEQTSGQAE